MFKTVIENLYEGVFFVDKTRKLTYWNSGAERISGYTAKQILGKQCTNNILSHIDYCGNRLCSKGCPIYDTILDSKERTTELFLHYKNGHRVPVLVKSIPYFEDGKLVGAIQIFLDNSEKLTYKQELRH